MSILTRTTALVGTGALLAVPAAVLVSAPAHADVERHGACGGGSYEFTVDREGRGFEVTTDLDRVQPGTRWKVVLRHDGRQFYERILRADHEGELDVERWRGNTSGQDTFKFRATRANGSAGCSGTISAS